MFNKCLLLSFLPGPNTVLPAYHELLELSYPLGFGNLQGCKKRYFTRAAERLYLTSAGTMGFLNLARNFYD
jgi:hypothetical protein